MKTYEVELRRMSFITMTVEADSKEQAEHKAWEYVKENNVSVNIYDANWDIESIEETTGEQQ